LLESIAKRLDLELMEKVVEMLPSVDMTADQRTYEILLTTNFTMRNFSKVKDLVAEMRIKKMPCTARANLVLLKTAVKTSSFDDALTSFRELLSMLQSNNLSSSVSTALRHITAQVAELACKERRLEEFLSELGSGVALTEELVRMLLVECARQKDVALTQRVEKLARENDVAFSDQTYGLLVKGLSGDPASVTALVDQALAQRGDVTSDFALAIISFCGQTANVAMADQLYEHLGKKKQLNVASALVRFYSEQEEYEKACDIYEKDIASLVDETQRSTFVDPRLERSLMNAAVRCGRSELTKTLF